jgi:hypothetical protein
MIIKNKKTGEDRAFWAHCEAVAAEVDLWPKWMGGWKTTPAKPTLKIGNYYHAPAWPVADHPLRLERNPRGAAYWALVRDGEIHWWRTRLVIALSDKK